MDAAIFGRAGLDHEAHLQFGRSVLPIAIYLRRQRNVGEQIDLSQPIGVVSGVVTVSNLRFCHITALAQLLFQRPADLYRFEVIFPNGQTVPLNVSHAQRHNALAAFFIPVPPGAAIERVHFSEDVLSENQPLRVFGHFISSFPPTQIQTHLSDGFVTHADPDFQTFGHDCTHSSCRGSPLFDNQHCLVGISFQIDGVTTALTLNSIRDALLQMYHIADMTISEIVDYLEGLHVAELPEV